MNEIPPVQSGGHRWVDPRSGRPPDRLVRFGIDEWKEWDDRLGRGTSAAAAADGGGGLSIGPEKRQVLNFRRHRPHFFFLSRLTRTDRGRGHALFGFSPPARRY
jgi:hypothetical protein